MPGKLKWTTLVECNNDLVIFTQLFTANVQRRLHSGKAFGSDEAQTISFNLLQHWSDHCTKSAACKVKSGIEYYREIPKPCFFEDFVALSMIVDSDRFRKDIWKDQYTGDPP
jgi:hypothetical protein